MPLLRDANVRSSTVLLALSFQLPPVLGQLALEEVHHMIHGHVGEVPGTEPQDSLVSDLLQVATALHGHPIPVLNLDHEGSHGNGLVLGGHWVLAGVDALADLVGQENGFLVCFQAVVGLNKKPDGGEKVDGRYACHSLLAL